MEPFVVKKKEFTISQNLSKPWKILEKEIAKCDVVCANCHAIRTEVRKTRKQIRPAKEKKAVCNRGHEFSLENSYIAPSTGNRACRICKSLNKKKWNTQQRVKFGESL